MKIGYTLIAIVLQLSLGAVLHAHKLPYIDKFGHVEYDKHSVSSRHSRVARSLDRHLSISFRSLNRLFEMRLEPAVETHFKHEFVEIGDKKVPLSDFEQQFYQGYLLDDPESRITGSIIDGVFYGTIETGDGSKFFIESARKFNESHNAHSIIYNEKHVSYNLNETAKNRRIRDAESGAEAVGCGAESVHEWMQTLQKEAYEKNLKDSPDFDSYYSFVEDAQDHKKKYSKEANEGRGPRKKRDDATRTHFPANRTVCNMYLKVDPKFYREIYRNEGNQDHEATVRFLMSYLQKHVEALNSIYSILPFYNEIKNEYYIGVRFSIHRTRLMTDDLCNREKVAFLSEAEQKLCEPYLDVQTFLSYVSLDNYTDFCLAYTFTARDFADGTLGLAWVAKPSGSIGGVCERRQSVQGTMKSLNCGIVTVINYQTRVAEAVSQITFAHEVGHNFGAEHDAEGQCVPGEKNGGNFIMYSRATTGTQPNNRNFSQCSKDSMGKVMFSLVSSPKFCLKVNNGSLCGNLFVEDGEECDCGYSNDCKEKCCNDASKVNACKLTVGSQCSPSQGPCCYNNCSFAAGEDICFRNTECSRDVYCNGDAAFCPKNDSSYFITTGDDGKLKDCNDGTQVCHSGICSGSICEKFDMIQCYLEGDLKDKKVNKEVLCHLACQGPATDNVCTDSFEIFQLRNEERNSSGFILKPGSACSGTQGYCDIFSKCRAVDAEGPLVRLKKLLLNPQTLYGIKTWATTYWWAVVLISVGTLLFMVVFIKVCSVHTPSSNPRKPPALKFSETLRRPIRRYHQYYQAHHPHSSALPGAQPQIHLSNRNASSHINARQSKKHSNGSGAPPVAASGAGVAPVYPQLPSSSAYHAAVLNSCDKARKMPPNVKPSAPPLEPRMGEKRSKKHAQQPNV